MIYLSLLVPKEDSCPHGWQNNYLAFIYNFVTCVCVSNDVIWLCLVLHFIKIVVIWTPNYVGKFNKRYLMVVVLPLYCNIMLSNDVVSYPISSTKINIMMYFLTHIFHFSWWSIYLVKPNSRLASPGGTWLWHCGKIKTISKNVF